MSHVYVVKNVSEATPECFGSLRGNCSGCEFYLECLVQSAAHDFKKAYGEAERMDLENLGEALSEIAREQVAKQLAKVTFVGVRKWDVATGDEVYALAKRVGVDRYLGTLHRLCDASHGERGGK